MNAGFDSAAAAARKLGMSRATYSQHENGIHAVSVKQAETYADLFGVPPAMILYGDDLVLYPDGLPKPRVTRVIGQVNDRGIVEPLDKSAPQWLPSFRGASVLHAVMIATDALQPAYYRGDHVLFAPLTNELKPQRVNGREVVLSMEHSRKMLALLTWVPSRREWRIKVANRPVIFAPRVYLASMVHWIKRA
jgi:transcriptional regulator with XRE-family HTH domain